jgi:DNA-binding MarR family transcriptional regulator/N-acetylglutamate synthase-like GNAT family acetyltransferase
VPPDVVAELGYLFLGSRLKRLAERLQADAYRVHRALGIDAQPAELVLLGAIERFGPMTVSEAVESLGVSQPAITRTAAGLVQRGALTSISSESDARQRTLKLTRQGRALVTKAKKRAWPLIGEAVAGMCEPLEGPLLTQLAELERQLNQRSLETRALDRSAPAPDELTIREYSDELAPDFYAINAAWIEAMFVLEDKDREILLNPRQTILDPGGFILFVESAELGIVGTCAVMKADKGVFELTKMGVLESARGRKAGDLMLRSAIERARAMDIQKLYLLTNSKCVAAIHLYEKHGFQHDAQVLETYGGEYARCDVAMSLPSAARESP